MTTPTLTDIKDWTGGELPEGWSIRTPRDGSEPYLSHTKHPFSLIPSYQAIPVLCFDAVCEMATNGAPRLYTPKTGGMLVSWFNEDAHVIHTEGRSWPEAILRAFGEFKKQQKGGAA